MRHGTGILLLALGALACRETPREPGMGGIRVVDDLGAEVRLQGPAMRIASLAPAYTEILFALGCGSRIVLKDGASDYPAEVSKIPAIDGMGLPAEPILSFRPDLVLAYQANPARLETLKKTGPSVASFDPRTIDDVFATIAKLGTLCGRPENASRLVASLKAQISRVRDRVNARAPVLLYVEVDGSDPSRPWTAGRGSFVDQIITSAGGKNIASDLGQAWVSLSAEEIVRRDPEAILLLGTEPRAGERDPERFAARPGWDRIRAVRERRVIADLPEALLVRPGPRLGQGIEALARRLHPEVW